MSKFLDRLKSHEMFRVVVAYAIVAWFLVQVVNNLKDLLELPGWIGPATAYFLAAAFPITLLMAWLIGPKAHPRAEEAKPLGVTDMILVTVGLTVIVLMGYQQIVPETTRLALTPGMRDLYRITAAFVITAWGVLELAKRATRVRVLPRWSTVAMSLLFGSAYAGAVALVWLTKFDPSLVLGATLPARAVDAVLAAGLFVVIGFELYYRVPAWRGHRQHELFTAAQSATHVQPQPLPSTSVAVLPFMNLSDDPAQDFFAEGITVEITSALANLPSLLVIGRVSAFRFKGHSQDLRDIGRQLGTTHLIEGSVRKEANRVRITVELIKAADGVCIWADRYDREVTDIFRVQEEIASAIARAMRVSLGLKLVRNSTNFDLFEKYLRAKALIRARGVDNLTEAAILLEQVVAPKCDPKFAPAWSMLAIAYCLTPNYHPAWFIGDSERLREVVKSCIPRAEAAARTAIELDPTDEHAYFALAYALAAQGKFIEAERNYEKAHDLDPGNPDILHSYGGFLIDVGRLPEALVFRRQLQKLEPLVPVFTWVTATVLWLNGHNDEAIAMLEGLSPDHGGRQFCLARVYASVGRYNEAADALERIGMSVGRLLQDASSLLRAAPTTVESPAALPSLGSLGFIYLYAGAPERFLEFFEGNIQAGYFCGIGWLWHPSYADVWRAQRFRAFVRAAGLIEYWRHRREPERIARVGRDVTALTQADA